MTLLGMAASVLGFVAVAPMPAMAQTQFVAPALPALPPRPGNQLESKANIGLVQFERGAFERRLSEVRSDMSEGMVDRPANRIVFTQPEVHLWVEAHAQGQRLAFVVDGMVDPEIQIRKGSRLVIKLVNVGWFGAVNLVIDPGGPPFQPLRIVPLPWQKTYPIADGRFAPFVPPRFRNTVYFANLTFIVHTTGRSWYRAVQPGTADAGMFGMITVVP